MITATAVVINVSAISAIVSETIMITINKRLHGVYL